jgi:hypothetical protein
MFMHKKGCSAQLEPVFSKKSSCGKRISRIAAYALGLILLVATVGFAQNGPSDAKSFFRNSIGNWIGTCRQSTDGKQAEDKYFHATIREADANTFTGQFDYYRLDAQTGRPLPIGQSSVTVTIAPDGTATSKISGQGIVMVEGKPKDQKHEFTENLTCSADGKLTGKGKGSISVSGMPFGVGKGGKVKEANSVWSMNNGTLMLSQSIKVGFKALVFSKSFKMDAQYTAKHGTNVAEIMPRSYAEAPKR